jgi:hypothetical protein
VGTALSGGWRTIGASVAGTSHAASGRACADCCTARVLALGDATPLLLAVVADGAGGAAHGALGARVASEAICDIVAGWASRNVELSVLEDGTARDWLSDVRERLAAAARLELAETRELATTLVVALVDESEAVFLQVGDGAAVYRDPCGRYRPAVWPQTGESANSTWFVTDPLCAERMELARAGGVDELALVSDGLQGLALRFGPREAHGPFFAPFFERLRGVPAAELPRVERELRSFLDSPAVNGRTCDDKTLLLATRLGIDG